MYQYLTETANILLQIDHHLNLQLGSDYDFIQLIAQDNESKDIDNSKLSTKSTINDSKMVSDP